MSKRDLITEELQRLPEPDLDKLLTFLRSLKESHTESTGIIAYGAGRVSEAKLDETVNRLIVMNRH